MYPLVQRDFKRNRPKIRSNLTWQIEHVLAKVLAKKAVEKMRQAAGGDDRAGTRRTKQLESLENSKKTLFELQTTVFTDFQSYATQCSKNR